MLIAVTIEGVTGLLCNRFHDAAAQAASDGRRGSSSVADRGTPQEICELKLYKNEADEPCIPQPNLLRCIVDGGKFHKAGRAQVTTKEGSMLFACVDILGTMIPIEHRDPWSVDTRPIVIPATKGRILTHRPLFHDWRLTFEAELNERICGVKLFRAVVDDAGDRIGLGDFRPSKKGPFGRFKVVQWAVQQESAPKESPALAVVA